MIKGTENGQHKVEDGRIEKNMTIFISTSSRGSTGKYG